MLLIILLYALFGTSMLIGKVLLQYCPPIFLAGTRMLLAGAVLIGFRSARSNKSIVPPAEQFWQYGAIILFGFCVNYILRFWALQSMSASKIAFLFNLSPFMAALYSYIFLNKKLSRLQWTGLLLGCFGLIPVLTTSSPLEEFLGEFWIISLPELAAFIAVAASTYSWIVMQNLVRHHNVSPIQVNGITMSIGGIISLLTAIFVEGPFPVTNVPAFSFWLILIVLISNIICHNLYGHLLRHYSATLLAFAGFMSPLFTALYGWLFFGDTVTWHFFLSSIIVMAGLYLFYAEELSDMQKVTSTEKD